VVAGLASGLYLERVQQDRLAAEAEARLEEGIAQFRAEQYEQALQTLEAIPGGASANWRIPYYTGSALVQLKRYDEGVLELEKALALNDRDPNTLFALGVAYYKLGQLSLSKGYFASVLEIDPGHEEARGLMDIMARLERFQQDQPQPPAEDGGG